MDKVIVNIGNKTYNCQLAKTEEEHKQGLMNVEYLAPDEGMLFEFEKEGTHEFWMKNTSLELTQISINDDDEVEYVYQAIPNDETLIPFENCKYLLEVNRTTDIHTIDWPVKCYTTKLQLNNILNDLSIKGFLQIHLLRAVVDKII